MTQETPSEEEKNFVFNKNKVPLIIENTRVFRPFEYKLLLGAIPKKEHRTNISGLFYTGLRYVEAQRFKENPQWFDGEFIHLPEMACLKGERKQLRRVIILNPVGRTIVQYFLDNGVNLPCWQSWKDNLRRWAVKAGLNPEKINVKTTRKTWESFLMSTYPTKLNEITLSQGHTAITSIQHYQAIGFNDNDKRDMLEFVEGWK